MFSPVSFNFIPEAYVRSVQNRIDVRQFPKEKIQEVIKTANVYEQELILQDLLIAGENMETREQRNMVALAAELFIKTDNETGRDFLMHLFGVSHTYLYKNFVKGIQANLIFHESMEMEKIDSGISGSQLKKERFFAIELEKYVK